MKLNVLIKFLLLVISSALLFITNNSHAAKTSLITKGSQNIPSYGSLYKSALSANGRFVVFSSKAEDLVIGDAFGSDVFLHDKNKNEITLISLGINGEQANGPSNEATISANGRFVAFSSTASNLVSGDTDNKTDVFVFDRLTKKMSCISCNSIELLLDSESNSPSISADGRFVAFASKGWNGSGYKSDVYVHDRQQNKIAQVSVNSANIAGDQDSGEPFISANGRFVAFSSWSSNLVSKTTNEYYEHHVFVHDLQKKKTTRVSVNSDGLPGDAFSVSSSPALNADGRFVVFASRATNLVPNDNNFKTDIFVHDQLTGKTERISIDSSGNEGNDNSHYTDLKNPWVIDSGTCACITTINPLAIGSGSPSITADGRFVAFDSYANNLITKDMNVSQDVFLHERYTGITRRVSVDSKGKEASYGSGFPSLSANGKVIVFTSKANITNYTNPENPQGGFSLWIPKENIYSKDFHVNTAKIPI